MKTEKVKTFTLVSDLRKVSNIELGKAGTIKELDEEIAQLRHYEKNFLESSQQILRNQLSQYSLHRARFRFFDQGEISAIFFDIRKLDMYIDNIDILSYDEIELALVNKFTDKHIAKAGQHYKNFIAAFSQEKQAEIEKHLSVLKVLYSGKFAIIRRRCWLQMESLEAHKPSNINSID